MTLVNPHDSAQGEGTLASDVAFKVTLHYPRTRRTAKTRSRALTPAAAETFRGLTSRLKETIRSIHTGRTDTDRTVLVKISAPGPMR